MNLPKNDLDSFFDAFVKSSTLSEFYRSKWYRRNSKLTQQDETIMFNDAYAKTWSIIKTLHPVFYSEYYQTKFGEFSDNFKLENYTG